MEMFYLEFHKIVYLNIAILSLVFAAFGMEIRFINNTFDKTDFLKRFVSTFIVPYMHIPVITVLCMIPVIMWVDGDYKFTAIISISPIMSFISSMLLLHSLSVINNNIKKISNPNDIEEVVICNLYLKYIYIFLGVLSIISFILGIIEVL